VAVRAETNAAFVCSNVNCTSSYCPLDQNLYIYPPRLWSDCRLWLKLFYVRRVCWSKTKSLYLLVVKKS